jgi:hypothetical protein
MSVLGVGIDVVPAARVERQERQIIELCQSPDFNLETLKEHWKKVRGVY